MQLRRHRGFTYIGMLVLVAVEVDDTPADVAWMAAKLLHELRVSRRRRGLSLSGSDSGFTTGIAFIAPEMRCDSCR